MSYVSSTYRKKEFIQIVIEQTFILKKDYISKWFSVKEVYTEVLQEEGTQDSRRHDQENAGSEPRRRRL